MQCGRFSDLLELQQLLLHLQFLKEARNPEFGFLKRYAYSILIIIFYAI